LRNLEAAGLERVPVVNLLDLDRLETLEGLESLETVG
jgi:hypothetical protein